uniref:Uncharacterized protein n=1 Tax=Aegilops tauschii subsp. strangulata TaxID=200361 RepID=A0A453KY71_AEGTS
ARPSDLSLLRVCACLARRPDLHPVGGFLRFRVCAVFSKFG